MVTGECAVLSASGAARMAMAGMRPPLTLLLPLLVSFFISPASAADTITANSSLADGQKLVSAGGVFELGFFTPGNSTARYLGIWYKDMAPTTVVWVANREDAITGMTGSLTINSTGSLVVADRSGRVFWSSAPSNVSSTGAPVAQLLDSGNFVLRVGSGAGGAILWQSFNHPSDTLLPGMKLGWNLTAGLDRYLTTWRSPGDPSPGDYTFGIDIRGVPEGFIWYDGAVPVYRNGPWNGLQFSGEPEMEPNNSNFQFEFVANASNVYYTFLVNGGGRSGVVSRFVLNQSRVQRYVWLPGGQGWSLYWSLPRDQCDHYAQCGAYGVCDSSGSPICDCLHGFAPASPRDWALRDNSAGCARRTRLNCTGDGFLLLRGVKLPDTTNATEDASITFDQCRQRCLANCSCLAYAASSIKGGESGCIIWSSKLIDIRQFSYGGQDLYIRLAASDLHGGGSSRKDTVLAVLGSLAGALLLGFGGFFIWAKFFRNKGTCQSTQRLTSFDSGAPPTPVQGRTIEDEHSHSKDLNVTLFDISTIIYSTDNFATSAKLGEGGFGAVYKGELEGGQTVAVKRLSKYSTQGLDEFKNEVMLIAKLQHVNLVRLLGCCIHGEERILVYEFMENKSLDNIIFDKSRSAQLNWSKRFNIILGIARGLLYLHQDSRYKVIHRDLKAGNILLDKDMNPKISDFGVARIFGDDTDSHTRKVVGTYGYMSPEYAMEGIFSVKSDVFSFGVLLLEIVSGRKNRGMYSSGEQTSLLSHAWKLWREGNVLALLDETVVGAGAYRSSEVLRCVQVGLLCAQERPEDRPHMAAVFLALSNPGAVLPQPRHPGFCSDRGGSTSTDGEWSSTCTVNDVTVTIVEGR
ncbi:receptor-like serine/threonine-protein kinase SD1-8 isoform X2 [Phragmites australis]|uniref:receptor-like serine/threonine-protein kinase SD1-8 isoform X2 n=1 Tax=Phragmites australis TaxID=29695 RepID=UPI002D791C3E|nr:receptor-like serine/threonine-protein kinase SD1-8 isoform X2 [Phragmites australis]